MADVQLLGLFHDVGAAGEAIARLRQLGVPDAQVTVLSGIPYKPEMLGRPHPHGGIGRFALLGAGLGLATALLLTIGTVLLYPQSQGGQPLIPVPPTLIIVFELTMLGTMWMTFFSLLLANRLPRLDPAAYAPEITEGAIGLLAQVGESLLDRVDALFTDQGAFRCQRLSAPPRRSLRLPLFWGAVGLAVLVGGGISMLLAYDVVKLPIPSNMVDQPSMDDQQGPRLAAPLGAVPVQGPELIAGQPASAPHPVTSDSLQRGKILFDINCALCHGPGGAGDGRLSGYLAQAKPANLTSPAVQNLPEAQLFMVITQGKGSMPSLAENLGRDERWDVINYLRQLKK